MWARLVLVTLIVVTTSHRRCGAVVAAAAAAEEENGERLFLEGLHPALVKRFANLRLYERQKVNVNMPVPDEREALMSPTFSADAPDLILAMGYGIQEEMSRFVRSFLPVASKLRMTLMLLKEEDMEVNAYLRSWGVELRHIRNVKGRAELERYELFEEYLAEPQQAQIEYVLITDIRDVVAQGNPFAIIRRLWPGKLVFTQEDPRLSLGTCPFNREWLRNLFNTSIIKKLAEQPVSCSGVTIGAVAPLRRYLRSIASLAMEAHAERAMVGKLPKELRQGADQGLHNCLVHNVCSMEGLEENSLAATPGDSLLAQNAEIVFHMGWVPEEEVIIDHFGRVRLESGSGLPALLHQFDRHPPVLALVLRMYPAVFPGHFAEELAHVKWLLGESAHRAESLEDDRQLLRGEASNPLQSVLFPKRTTVW